MADQQQDYSKGARATDRDVETHSLEMISGGKSTGGNSGPTGSPRDYGKSGKSAKEPSMKNWNPMKEQASTYGINGCG